jgi:hypothetical protein
VSTRSKVLLAKVLPPGRGYETYTCPPDKFVLVKSYALQNRDSVERHTQLMLQDPISGALVYLADETLASLAIAEKQIWHVMEPAQLLIAYADGPNVHCWVSGAVLPLPS